MYKIYYELAQTNIELKYNHLSLIVSNKNSNFYIWSVWKERNFKLAGEIRNI